MCHTNFVKINFLKYIDILELRKRKNFLTNPIYNMRTKKFYTMISRKLLALAESI